MNQGETTKLEVETRYDELRHCGERMYPLNVFVMDSSRIGTELLQTVLSADSRFRVIQHDYSTANAEQARAADVAIISAEQDDDPLKGCAFGLKVRAVAPNAKLVMLVDHPGRDVLLEAFRVGSRGLFGRNESIEALGKCICSVHEGQVWASGRQLAVLLDALQEPLAMRFTDVKGKTLLSKREQEIVYWVAEGLTNREIADRLKLSEHTIKNYLFRMFDKLGISSRVELIVYGIRQLSAEAGPKRELLRDELSALHLCREAVERCSVAPYALAQMYRNGTGVPADPAVAFMWFIVAENLSVTGQQRSKAAQEALLSVLSSDQIENARRKANESLSRVRIAQNETIEGTHEETDIYVPLYSKPDLTGTM